MAQRSTGVVIIALILGVAGLGLGTYSSFLKEPIPGPPGADGDDGVDGTDGIDGINGTDGEDAPGYFCISESEINDALTAIGTGAGRIIITENITLTATITVDQGGTYTIEGESTGITIDCNGNREAISIDDVDTLVLKDLTIEAADITSTTTSIIHVNDRNVNIDNVRILGDSDYLGRGVYITDIYTSVTNCYIYQLRYGIWSTNTGSFANIEGNIIEDCDIHGMYLDGPMVICEENQIVDCENGLWVNVNCHSSTFSNNILTDNYNAGIYTFSQNSTYSGNVIYGSLLLSAADIYGMYIGANADYNTITGNNIHGIATSLASDGYALYLSTAEYNCIVGNTLLGSEINFFNASGGSTNLFANNVYT